MLYDDIVNGGLRDFLWEWVGQIYIGCKPVRRRDRATTARSRQLALCIAYSWLCDIAGSKCFVLDSFLCEIEAGGEGTS